MKKANDVMNRFFDVCKIHNQFKLKGVLETFLKSNGYKVVNGNGYLYGEPKKHADPVCLTAHMDTVHKEPIEKIRVEKHEKQTIISSPQGIGGDDRCGIFMIMEVVRSGMKPYIVFCEDEEIGCVGAGKFAKTDLADKLGNNCMFIVELDRRNATDAVYYELDNIDFEEYITNITGYKTAIGSYSDICEIAPMAGIAAVNLSCGYYNEHHLEHYVVWEEMMNTLSATKKLIKASAVDKEKFEYKELPIQSRYFNYYGGYNTSKYETGYNEEGWSFVFDYWDGEKEEFVSGCSYEECVGQLLIIYPDLTYSQIKDCYQEF